MQFLSRLSIKRYAHKIKLVPFFCLTVYMQIRFYVSWKHLSCNHLEYVRTYMFANEYSFFINTTIIR